MKIPRFVFSHLALHAFDEEAQANFYKECLGFVETDRGILPGGVTIIFMSRDPKDHHQVVFASGRTSPRDTLLINQVSFLLNSLDDLKALGKHVRDDGRATDFDPVNHGNAWSLYFKDPEGNRVELFVNSPWYIPQPKKDFLDLDKPTSEILAETEAMCRATEGFRPVEEFQAEVAAKLEN
jgi:catechol-2,3-dioxygenase